VKEFNPHKDVPTEAGEMELAAGNVQGLGRSSLGSTGRSSCLQVRLAKFSLEQPPSEAWWRRVPSLTGLAPKL